MAILCRRKKMFLGIHVKCQIFLPIFKQIWISYADTYRSFRYKISQKSVQWEQRWYMQKDGLTGGHHDANRRLSGLWERAYEL
jgi:DNA-binding helix-hairpin-helix protein with protein kinase domain